MNRYKKGLSVRNSMEKYNLTSLHMYQEGAARALAMQRMDAAPDTCGYK